MKRWSAAFLLLGALLCAAVLLHCGGSEVVGLHGGSEVVGKLVTKDNHAAVGAKVSVYLNSFDTSKQAFAAASTDKNGNYRAVLDTTGTFFIYCTYTKKDTLLVAYIPDVRIDTVAPDKKTTYSLYVGTDTLLPPGSVSGRVTIYTAQNSLIMVNIPGTSYIAITDGAGNFKITNIPAGTYPIWFSKDGFSTDSSQLVTITSGRDTVIAPVVLKLDPTKPVPAPSGFTATPDIKHGTVELKWNSVPSTNLSGYMLSRNKAGSSQTDSVLGTIAKPDTFFIDTVYRSINDTLPQTIHYSIESIDNNSKHSVTATPVTVDVIPPIKPGTVAIVSADSTYSTVTVRWNRFPDSNFSSYKLHFRPVGKVSDSIIMISLAADTSCTFTTLANGTMLFSIQVINAQGIASVPSPTRSVSIINSPPRFSVDTSGLDDSVNIGAQSMFTLDAVDTNSDSLSFSLKTPLAGLSIQDGNVFFEPAAISLVGPHRVVVVVNDLHGGIDSMVWNVRVVAHDAWVPGDSLINARRLFGAVTLNGKIYVIGGQVDNLSTGRQTAIKTVEMYDTATGRWTQKASLATARWGLMAAVSTATNRIYAFGGSNEKSYIITSIEEYNPATDIWTPVGNMPFYRSNGAACIIGNNLYCIGGKAYDAAKGFEAAVKSIDIYNLNSGNWSNGPLMRNARTDHRVCVYNGLVYIIGGTGASSDSVDELTDGYILNTMEAFNPAGAGRCDSLMLLQDPRSNFGAVNLGNQVFCIGGLRSLTETSLLPVEIANVTLKNSTLKTSTAEQRYSHQSVELGGRIYCIGGVLGTGNSTRSVTFYFP